MGPNYFTWGQIFYVGKYFKYANILNRQIFKMGKYFKLAKPFEWGKYLIVVNILHGANI